MNRRELVKTMGLLLTLPVVSKLTGCKEEVNINDEWESKVTSLEEADVLSATEPGEWEGKEGSHVPEVTDNGDGTVTLSTPHGMTPPSDDDAEHYIDVIYLKDQNGTVIGLAEFTAEDEEAITTITLPAGTTQVVGYSSCNLHGLWQSESVSVG